MADDRAAFEARLADVFDRYADRAPVDIDPWVVAQAAARSPAPGWRSRIAWPPAPRAQDRGWLQLAIALALVGLLLAAFGMAMWVGGQRQDPALLTDPALLIDDSRPSPKPSPANADQARPSPAASPASSSPARPSPAAPPANADLLAFTDGRAGGLYVRDMRSGELRLLDPEASTLAYGGAQGGAIDGRAAWSPDREQIAYFANFADGPRDGSGESRLKSLRVLRVADGRSREVAQQQANSSPWGNYEQLAWSPDGRWIATPTLTPQGYRLMLVNVDDPSRSMVLSSDDAPAPIVGGGAIDWNYFRLVGWSPSGRSVALMVGAAPWTSDFYVAVVNADGSGSRAIELPSPAVNRVWWLDEDHLLLKRDESLNEAGGPPADVLSVLDLGSGQVAPFAADPGPDPWWGDLLLRTDPAISPDRGLIAFYGEQRVVPPARIEGVGLFVIDAEGRIQNQIAADDFCVRDGSQETERIDLDFSPSGRQVLMGCRSTRSWALIDLDRGTVEDVELGPGWANW